VGDEGLPSGFPEGFNATKSKTSCVSFLFFLFPKTYESKLSTLFVGDEGLPSVFPEGFNATKSKTSCVSFLVFFIPKHLRK
jgi:hypothetical protein